MQLRQCRQAVGLSLRQLAARVGYDHSYLSQVERGQRPGSADLARFCDRELGTGNRLLTAYERAHRTELPVTQPSPVAGDLLAAAWCGLARTFDGAWEEVPADDLADLRKIPPARLLPELASEIHLLNARRSPGASGARVAQLSVLVATTLTGLGQVRAARRWWLAARVAADSSGEGWVRSLVRVREAVSGLAERRPLAQLLEMAQEGLAHAVQGPAALVAQARGARAQVLAEMGRTAEAHQALQEMVGAELPAASTASGSLADWASYEVHSVEGRVCSRLGYGIAGCVMLSRALELCPGDWLGERAGVEMELAECLVLDGEVAAGLALALRVLVELPDEWHTYYLYDAGERVLSAVREKEPGGAAVRDLQELLRRAPYLSSRSVGSGSSYAGGQG